MKDRPYFLWDVDITEDTLRLRLQHADPKIRAQWQGNLMREARFEDVWKYVTLAQVLANWDNIRRHLGRRLELWQFLLNGWRADGLLAA